LIFRLTNDKINYTEKLKKFTKMSYLSTEDITDIGNGLGESLENINICTTVSFITVVVIGCVGYWYYNVICIDF
jgi:hypothetical protein